MKFIISIILYQICTNRSQVCTFLLKRLVFSKLKCILVETPHYHHQHHHASPVWSFDRRKRQPDESKTEAEKQSKSVGESMAAFLVLSKKPIRRSITITCPSFVFSSFTDFISNHLGLSCKTKTS